jgi:hypothetical protein
MNGTGILAVFPKKPKIMARELLPGEEEELGERS